MATPTGAGRFNGREPHAVVGGNDAAHRGDRYPVCLAISWARLRGNQRVIDNPPAVSHPEARIQFHAPFDFFQGKMRCGSGDSASHDACSLLFISFLYYTTWNASWYQGKETCIHLRQRKAVGSSPSANDPPLFILQRCDGCHERELKKDSVSTWGRGRKKLLNAACQHLVYYGV